MYEDFIKLINQYREHHNLNLTIFSNDDLNREEERFGPLPPSYREFLRTCPTGSFFEGSFILYEGLLSFEDLSLEVRTVNEQGLVAFGDDLGGTILCFDVSNPDENGEWSVVEYKYPDSRVQIAENFSEWLMAMIGLCV